VALAIHGLGLVTALGNGVDALRAGLAGDVEPAIEQCAVSIPGGEQTVSMYRAHPEGLETFVSSRAMRRLDSLQRMALLAAHLAFEDAGIDPSGNPRIGIVFGTGHGALRTTYGFLDSILDGGDEGASPTLFANSVHTALAAQVSINMKIQAPCTTLTCFDQTAISAFETAKIWLDRGDLDFVLVGLGDEISDVTAYTAALARAKSAEAGGSARVRPLELDSFSFSPAEGFVCLVLGREAKGGAHPRVDAIERLRADASGRIDVDFSGDRCVLLGADGIPRNAPAHRALRAESVPCTAHAALLGSLRLSLGFEVAIGALALREGLLRPMPDAVTSEPWSLLHEPLALAPGDRLACVKGHGATEASLIRLSRPRSELDSPAQNR
jgi:hypothetical protein